MAGMAGNAVAGGPYYWRCCKGFQPGFFQFQEDSHWFFCVRPTPFLFSVVCLFPFFFNGNL